MPTSYNSTSYVSIPEPSQDVDVQNATFSCYALLCSCRAW